MNFLIFELDAATGFKDIPDVHVFATIGLIKTFNQNTKLLFENGISTEHGHHPHK